MAPSLRDPFRSPLFFATSLLQLTVCALTLTAPIAAQEFRLEDGRILVGKYTVKGDTTEIETRDGKVVVPTGAISSRTEIGELRQKLAQLAKKSGDSAFAHLHLAMQARDYGLEREMWRHVDKALEQLAEAPGPAGPPTDSNPVERRLRDFLAQLEPELLPTALRQAPTDKRVRHLLRSLRVDTGPGERAAIEELLVREANADEALRREARRNSTPRQRIGALAALQRRNLPGNDRFVLRTAVLDGSKDVRESAIAIGRPFADEDDVSYMAAGLVHHNAKVRVRTAEALGELGQPSAIELLVKAGPHAGTGLVAAGGGPGPVTRGHVAFLQQQAYVRDYDVEVAQAAFIADPRVDVLQSGTVLDVTVMGVYEVRTILRTYRAALKQLTSQDPGPDPRVWPTWLERLPAPVETADSTTPPPVTGKR